MFKDLRTELAARRDAAAGISLENGRPLAVTRLLGSPPSTSGGPQEGRAHDAVALRQGRREELEADAVVAAQTVPPGSAFYPAGILLLAAVEFFGVYELLTAVDADATNHLLLAAAVTLAVLAASWSAHSEPGQPKRAPGWAVVSYGLLVVLALAMAALRIEVFGETAESDLAATAGAVVSLAAGLAPGLLLRRVWGHWQVARQARGRHADARRRLAAVDQDGIRAEKFLFHQHDRAARYVAEAARLAAIYESAYRREVSKLTR